MTIFNSYVTNYQRVPFPSISIFPGLPAEALRPSLHRLPLAVPVPPAWAWEVGKRGGSRRCWVEINGELFLKGFSRSLTCRCSAVAWLHFVACLLPVCCCCCGGDCCCCCFCCCCCCCFCCCCCCCCWCCCCWCWCWCWCCCCCCCCCYWLLLLLWM